jgi:hypothetical protein
MKWKKELAALVEENRAFAKSVKGNAPATPPVPVAPRPEEVAEPPIDLPVRPATARAQEPPPPQRTRPSRDDV